MPSGFRFDAAGVATPLTEAEIRALPARPQERVWIDLEGHSKEHLALLSDVFKFHPLAIDDCLSKAHHPKIDEFEDHLFLIFRGIDFDLKQDRMRTTKLACFLGENLLVTVHRVKMKSVSQVATRCIKDVRVGQRGPDFILYAILDVMVDLYFPELEEFEAAVDALQVRVFDDASPEVLRAILKLRRDTMHLRRFAAPQRDVLNRLARPDYRYIRPANAIYFRDIYDHTFRIADEIDNQRDGLLSLTETYTSMVSNRLNEVLKVLTLITTVFIPMGFVASVYGMNFKQMPEIEWRYGYLFSLVLMAVIGGGLLLWFRRKRWLWTSQKPLRDEKPPPGTPRRAAAAPAAKSGGAATPAEQSAADKLPDLDDD